MILLFLAALFLFSRPTQSGGAVSPAHIDLEQTISNFKLLLG